MRPFRARGRARLPHPSPRLSLFHPKLAAIFEFLGALVLGRVSTSTIAGSIADPKAFAGPGGPEAYAYGMVIALGEQ